MTRQIELSPIREEESDWDPLETAILKLFREQIYLPLMLLLREPLQLKNSIDDMKEAIQSGRIVFYRGLFKGRFNASLSKELLRLGAKWDGKQGGFAIPVSKLPDDVRMSISISEAAFKKMTEKLSDRIRKILPDSVAEELKTEKIFEGILGRTEKKFGKSIDGFAIAPEVTPEMRRRIAAEYTKNLQLYINDFTQKETEELRKRVEELVFKGVRYEQLAKEIRASYGVSQRKAKFLARQETSLMMTKYKQTRYQEAGVNRYIWRCVIGSKNHPVRPMHKKNDGKTFSWDNPPIVSEDGSRKNPGQDYNCRCAAVPLVNFKESLK